MGTKVKEAKAKASSSVMRLRLKAKALARHLKKATSADRAQKRALQNQKLKDHAEERLEKQQVKMAKAAVKELKAKQHKRVRREKNELLKARKHKKFSFAKLRLRRKAERYAARELNQAKRRAERVVRTSIAVRNGHG